MIGSIQYNPHDEDTYSFWVHEIIEQMLSIKAEAPIYARLENLCSRNITVSAINSLSDEQIRSIGTSASKVSYIRSLTQAVVLGILNLAELPELDNKEIIKSLTSINGIGNWTSKMYLIFVLNRQDILPTEDIAFVQAYECLYKTDDRSPVSSASKCKNGNHTPPSQHDTYIAPRTVG